MHIIANNGTPISVTNRFRNKAIPHLNLSVIEIYSFPFNRPGISTVFSPPEWAFEYHYGYAGKIKFLNPGSKCSLERESHMVHLYAPGCLFQEDTRKSIIPRQETYIRFKGGELCGLEKLTGKNRRFCRFIDRDHKIGAILEQATQLCFTQGEKSFWEIQSLLINCISVFLQETRKISEHTYEMSSEPSTKDLFLANVERYIRQNISRNICNAELADYLNLSESTFNHRFKKLAGTSPKNRVLEIKIDTAKTLLLRGKRLQEIAGLTGFHDEFHLSRTFRRFSGESPSVFRNHHGKT